MSKDKNKELENKVHGAFLSDEEKLKIQKEVEEQLDKENKKKVADDYRQSLIAEAKRKALLSDAKSGSSTEGLVPVFVDLPAVSECIRLDGMAYYPGRTYNVTPEVASVINEIMHRGREHEDSLNGKTAKENMFRKQGKTTVPRQ